MTYEGFPEPELEQQEHEGDRYLRLLGLDHLAYEQIPGRPDLLVRDFLEVCGERARPMLMGFASLSPDDPRYELVRGVLLKEVTKYIDRPISG